MLEWIWLSTQIEKKPPLLDYSLRAGWHFPIQTRKSDFPLALAWGKCGTLKQRNIGDAHANVIRFRDHVDGVSLRAPAAVRNNIITCAAAAAGSPWCHILYNAVDNLFFIATLSSSPRLFSSTYTLSLARTYRRVCDICIDLRPSHTHMERAWW